MSLEFHTKELRVMATFNLLCKVYSQVGQGVCFSLKIGYTVQTLIQVWLKSMKKCLFHFQFIDSTYVVRTCWVYNN